MLTILNRKELCITFSLQQQSKIRASLTKNHIPYTVNEITPSAPGLGVVDLEKECISQYIIYVHKDDFEKAKFLTDL
ncbi:MAG: hypothetical protein HFE58_07490 [Firmicutes bacterium]|jgi:hypothetical protein|nr:hypothetical protein [Bacillota bacterium]